MAESRDVASGGVTRRTTAASDVDSNADKIGVEAGTTEAEDEGTSDQVSHAETDNDSESESDSVSSSSENTTSEESGSEGSDLDADHLTVEQPDLRARLAAFMPQIATANKTLSDSQRLDEVGDDEERYIEMNLGLGVLEKTDKRDDVLTRALTSDAGKEYQASEEPILKSVTSLPPRKRRKIEEV